MPWVVAFEERNHACPVFSLTNRLVWAGEAWQTEHGVAAASRTVSRPAFLLVTYKHLRCSDLALFNKALN